MNRLAELGSPAKSEHERFLTEKHAKKPVIVMNYPKDIKAFYMRLNDGVRAQADADFGIGMLDANGILATGFDAMPARA